MKTTIKINENARLEFVKFDQFHKGVHVNYINTETGEDREIIRVRVERATGKFRIVYFDHHGMSALRDEKLHRRLVSIDTMEFYFINAAQNKIIECFGLEDVEAEYDDKKYKIEDVVLLHVGNKALKGKGSKTPMFAIVFMTTSGDFYNAHDSMGLQDYVIAGSPSGLIGIDKYEKQDAERLVSNHKKRFVGKRIVYRDERWQMDRPVECEEEQTIISPAALEGDNIIENQTNLRIGIEWYRTRIKFWDNRVGCNNFCYCTPFEFAMRMLRDEWIYRIKDNKIQIFILDDVPYSEELSALDFDAAKVHEEHDCWISVAASSLDDDDHSDVVIRLDCLAETPIVCDRWRSHCFGKAENTAT